MSCSRLSKLCHVGVVVSSGIGYRERVVMIEAQCDERTSEIRKKMQLQTGLNCEIRKLQDQIRMANMSFEEVNNQEQQKREKLFGLDADIARKNDEMMNLEKVVFVVCFDNSCNDNLLCTFDTFNGGPFC